VCIVRAPLAGVLLLIALFAMRQAAHAECSPAPAGGAYFVTDREPVGGEQLFSGERGLTKSRDAVVTRGVIVAATGKRDQPCSSEKAFFAALSLSFAPKGARQGPALHSRILHTVPRGDHRCDRDSPRAPLCGTADRVFMAGEGHEPACVRQG